MEERLGGSGGGEGGGIAWRRTGAMLLVLLAAAFGLVMATAKGALAAQFSISGMPFTVTASSLTGNGFEQFATLDHMAPHSPNAGNTGGQVVVVVSAIQTAELTNQIGRASCRERV